MSKDGAAASGIVFVVLLVIVAIIALFRHQPVQEVGPEGVKFGEPPPPKTTPAVGKNRGGDEPAPAVTGAPTNTSCELPLSFKVFDGAKGPPLICKDMKAGHLTAILTGRVIVEDSGEKKAYPFNSGYKVRLDVPGKECEPPTDNCQYFFPRTNDPQGTWPDISTLTVETDVQAGTVMAFVRFPLCVTDGAKKTNCRFEYGSTLTMRID